jgi:hypothetical protein
LVSTDHTIAGYHNLASTGNIGSGVVKFGHFQIVHHEKVQMWQPQVEIVLLSLLFLP